MLPDIPIYITALFFVIVALLLSSLFYALNYAYDKLQLTRGKKYWAFTVTGALLFGWLTVSSLVAFRGTLLNFTAAPPKILLILLPAILAIIYISNSKRVNAILEVIPHDWLVYIQSFRVLVEIFLWMMFAKGIIPLQMTFEGINYDILAGLSAPLVAYYTFSIKKWPQIVALLWNFSGFLLVLNITIVAIVSAPGPLRQFFNEPANTMIAYFPYVWLPAFIVPFAFLMHVLSIKQLIRFKNV
jgi:hypothetical protein